MLTPANTAFLLAAVLLIFGGATAWFQLRGRRILRARQFVPSDELAYFRRRYRIRLINGVLIATIGAMIGGAYLTGLERRADDLGEHKPDAQADPEAKPKMDDDQKFFVRIWAAYWIVVLVLVFAVLSLALRDAWATRAYAMKQYAHIRDEHEQKLRRDLAVYRAHKANASGGNRMTGHLPSEGPPPG